MNQLINRRHLRTCVTSKGYQGVFSWTAIIRYELWSLILSIQLRNVRKRRFSEHKDSLLLRRSLCVSRLLRVRTSLFAFVLERIVHLSRCHRRPEHDEKDDHNLSVKYNSTIQGRKHMSPSPVHRYRATHHYQPLLAFAAGSVGPLPQGDAAPPFLPP